MKILHIASFLGNIGDNASHFGLINILERFFQNDLLEISRLEIRRFYKNYSLSDRLLFDNALVNKINEFDLTIIGGGGFLDYWVPDSKTGTTIDIDPKLLQAIKKPLLFSSVGALPHKPVPEGNLEKFRFFLDCAFQNDNIQFALRNDGSIDNLKSVLGDSYSNMLHLVCDNAFFYEEPKFEFGLDNAPFIIINTTADQPLMRNNLIGKIDSTLYILSLQKTVKHLIENTEYSIVFMPHIYNDINAIRMVVDGINDYHVRSRISIAPYLSGDNGSHKLFSLYKRSILNVGMRFHANICSLGLGSLSIGLAALDRVIHMYKSIGLSNESFVLVDQEFSHELIKKIDHMLLNKESVLKLRKNLVDEIRDRSLQQYSKILNGIIN